MAILDKNGVLDWATSLKVLSDATYESKLLKFTNVTVPTSAFESNRTISELEITLNTDLRDSAYLVFDNNVFKAKIDSLNLTSGTYTFAMGPTGPTKCFVITPGNIYTDPIVYDSTNAIYNITAWGITINSNIFSSGEGIEYFYINYIGKNTVSQYSDYPCRATIELTGVINEMIPEVIFDIDDSISRNYNPISEAYMGGIYIFSKSIPSTALSIPTIICWAN